MGGNTRLGAPPKILGAPPSACFPTQPVIFIYPMACMTATNAFWHSGVQNSLNLSFFILSPEDAKVASPQGQTLVPLNVNLSDFDA